MELVKKQTKICSQCGIKKSVNEFYFDSLAVDTLRSNCKSCHNKASRERRYGISHSSIETLITKQDGKCAICKVVLGLKFDVDHDYRTNKIRGILCPDCNKGIGRLKDSVEILKQAILYLEK